MGRSSRIAFLLLSTGVASTSAHAQLYGFPSSVGVIDDGFGALPPSQPAFGPPPGEAPPPPFPPLPPRPAPCPVVLKIGRGLAHPAHVRVVYGRPACL